MQIFALELGNDTPESLVEKFLRKVDAMGFRCKTLEAMDVVDLGSTNFLRLRSDLPQFTEVVNSFYEPKVRGTILPGTNGYVCKLSNGRSGVVAISKMQLAPRVPPKTYRGNAMAHWERQFLKGD